MTSRTRVALSRDKVLSRVKPIYHAISLLSHDRPPYLVIGLSRDRQAYHMIGGLSCDKANILSCDRATASCENILSREKTLSHEKCLVT